MITFNIFRKTFENFNLIPSISLVVSLVFFYSTNISAQELPAPNSLYVSTQCFVREGNTFQDVVEEGRTADIAGPNIVFFRQPIAGSDTRQNQFLRIVVWDNMADWASNVIVAPSETYTCNNNNRRFWTNRNIGNNRNAYSETDVSLVTTRRCTAHKGYNISDVYNSLSEIQRARESEGNTSVMHLSHLVLGPYDDSEMRRTIIIRTIGESEIGLARDLDSNFSNDLGIGTPANAPTEHCNDASLTRSYMVYNASR